MEKGQSLQRMVQGILEIHIQNMDISANQDSAEVNKRSVRDGRLQSRGPSDFHLAAETHVELYVDPAGFSGR